MTGTTRVIGAVGFMGPHLFESLLDPGEHVVTEDDLFRGLIENVPEVAAFGNYRTTAPKTNFAWLKRHRNLWDGSRGCPGHRKKLGCHPKNRPPDCGHSLER